MMLVQQQLLFAPVLVQIHTVVIIQYNLLMEKMFMSNVMPVFLEVQPVLLLVGQIPIVMAF